MYIKQQLKHNSNGENMKIEDVMTKDLIVVGKEKNLSEVAMIMKQCDIGFVPISENNKIIGVLTDRDIVTNILANKDDKIEDYYSKNLITVDKDEDLNKAVDMMGEKKVKRLLVSDGNKLVGVLSLSDVINAVNKDEMIINLKKLWAINRNSDRYKTEIDEFIL